MPDEKPKVSWMRQTSVRDSSQLQAIYAPINAHHVVIAPAGYGKTYVMAKRIAYLITAGYVRPPYRVLGLTFTNSAAATMQRRVAREVDQQFHECIDIMNFHSFCYQALVAYGTEIGIQPDFIVVGEQKTDNGPGLTYDDLLLGGKALLEISRILALYRAVYRYIVVDEFQDTNPCQFGILRLLVKGLAPQNDDRPVMIFADKEQAIYEFRDARPENVDHALSEFGCRETIRLTQNHRVKNNDIDALGRLLRTDDFGIEILPQRKYPLSLSRNVAEEAPRVAELIQGLQQRGISLHEICVIAATGYRLNSIIEQLDTSPKVPYVFIPSFQTKEIEDKHPTLVEKLTEIAQKGSNTCRSLLDVIPKTDGEGKTDPVLNLMRVMAQQYDSRYRNLPLKRRAAIFRNHLYLEIDWGTLIRERCTDRVFISTIHGVKGLEFEHVVLVGMEDRGIPHWKICRECRNGNSVESLLKEPARQLHVAVTRSISEVYFFSVQQQTSQYGGVFDRQTTCLLSPIQSYLGLGVDVSVPVLCQACSVS